MREDGMPEPERKPLTRSRYTSGRQRNGSDRGGQGRGNGVEFPSSVEPRAGPAELTKDFSRGATERTRAAAPTDQPDLTAEVERTSAVAPTERTRRVMCSQTNT